MFSEVSKRYAKALYEITSQNGTSEKALAELRILVEIYNQQPELAAFFGSPVVAPDSKVKAIEVALGSKISEAVVSTLKLMATKNRLGLFGEVAMAYESISDEAHGVTRGVVRSAKAVTQAEKEKIEQTVNQVTKKKVILTYQEDKALLGGMVTQVGGWTFDDSLHSHLNKLTEELNRR